MDGLAEVALIIAIMYLGWCINNGLCDIAEAIKDNK